MATVTESTTEAVATADTPRPSRLQVIVALAVLCRDNGIEWPRDVQFSDDYPDGLWIKTSSLANLTALTDAMGRRRPTETSATDEHIHSNARADWSGFKVYLLHLGPLPVVPAPVDGATSAAIDDLVATVNTERVEVGADGCGCPITEEIRANGSSVEGTERVEHRARCWNAPAGTHEEAVAR